MPVGKLVQVSTAVSDGSVTSLTVTGINDDSVYMIVTSKLATNNNNEAQQLRVTTSGTADSDSEYDQAHRYLSSTSQSNGYQTNADKSSWLDNCDDDNGGGQGIAYLYNFNNSSEYSFWTYETVATVSNQTAGLAGGTVHTVAEANDGVQIFGLNGGTYKDGARITLYRVV